MFLRFWAIDNLRVFSFIVFAAGNEGRHQKGKRKMKNTQGDAKHKTQFLVIGGTGKTGKRVVDRLNAMGLQVRSASRSSEIRFDWNDDATWAANLEEVNAVYITYSPDIAVPGAPENAERFTRLAKEMGVQRIVLLTGRGETEAQRAEQLVRAVDPDTTIVRASWFNQNFSEGVFSQMIRQGSITLPRPEAVEPHIDIEDIADVVTAALTEPGHEGETYEVTGPRLMTFADIASDISSAIGRDISYVPIETEQLIAGMEAAGSDAMMVEMVAYLFDTVLDGRNAHICDGVERALGRPPRDFREFAQRTAASGVWNPDIALKGTAG